MNAALCAVALAIMLSSASAKDFECPNNDYGWYGDPENCIRYFHCSLGVSEEYLCPISELVAIAVSSLEYIAFLAMSGLLDPPPKMN